MLIDVAIPGDRNVIKKEAQKILKYKDLIIEIQHTWNVKAKVTPVITGATGAISKSLRQYLNNVPGKHEIKEVKKKPIGHCTHTSESTNVKVQIYFTCEITLHVAQIVIQENYNTIYPRHMVCFRYIIVNTLHKYNNNNNINNI